MNIEQVQCTVYNEIIFITHFTVYDAYIIVNWQVSSNVKLNDFLEKNEKIT